jgi:hypothetical protein
MSIGIRRRPDRTCDRRCHGLRCGPSYGGVPCASNSITSTQSAFEVTSKRRKGFPSETHVKRGTRVVGGRKELSEKLGRNDPCPCLSGRRFQELLHAHWGIGWLRPASFLSGNDWSRLAFVGRGARRKGVKLGERGSDSALATLVPTWSLASMDRAHSVTEILAAPSGGHTREIRPFSIHLLSYPP